MANLPSQYNRPVIEDELRKLSQRIEDMKKLLTFIPVNAPVTDPKIGMIMYADGEENNFSGDGVRGLYRYGYLNKDVDNDLGWIRFASADTAPYVLTGNTGETHTYYYLSDFLLVKHSRTSIGTWTVALPDPSVQKYRTLRIVSDDSTDANHKVALDPGTFTIDGSTADYEINRSFEGVTLFSDGVNWIIIQAKDK